MVLGNSFVKKNNCKCHYLFTFFFLQVQAILLAIVVFISLGSLVLKVLLNLRTKYYTYKQKQFVEWNRYSVDDDTESAVSCFSSTKILYVLSVHAQCLLLLIHSMIASSTVGGGAGGGMLYPICSITKVY